MKKIAKLIALALCFALLFGCANANSKNTTSQPESQTPAAATSQSALDILTTAKTATMFTSEPISEDHIKQILSAGLNAPSARNSQPWHFSVVTNKDVLNQIADAMSGGTSSASSSQQSSAPKRLGLADAPVAVFVYGTDNLPTDSFDCGLATEAMSIAALSLGYGTKILSSPSTTLNGEKKAEFDKLLQIPEGYSNVAVLLIGHNDVDAATGASTRSSMEEKVKFIN